MLSKYGPALPVADLEHPVGSPRAAGKLGLRAGQAFFSIKKLQLRMRGEPLYNMLARLREARRVGRIGERPLRFIADQGGEHDARAGRHAFLLDQPVVCLLEGEPHHEGLGDALPAAGDRGRDRFAVELQLPRQPLERCLNAFGEVHLQPSHGDVAVKRGALRCEIRALHVAHALGAQVERGALGAVRKLLHPADLAHGHEIAAVVEAVGPGDGKVFNSQPQLGIGQLARAPELRFGGAEHVALRRQARRLRLACLKRVFERERLAERRQRGERERDAYNDDANCRHLDLPTALNGRQSGRQPGLRCR
jgi:hypothetical protein